MDENIREISTSSLFAYWHNIRESIRECLRRTPDELLSWKPKHDMLAFGQLYMHLANSVDWWLTNYVKDGGEWIPSERQQTDDRDRLDEHLVASFARLGKYAMLMDTSLTYKDKDGYEFSGNWLLLHLFEHDVHHRGQLKTYLRLNGIAPPVD
jgi:uncharacterized damage-inducible protein DinB